MITKNEINRLLQTLHELYYKLCDRDLRKRMSSYHRDTSSNDAPDISTSVINNFDKLTPASKPSNAAVTSSATDRSSNKPAKTSSATQPKWLNKVVSSFNRPKKIFASKIAPNQKMGEKLKDSTWSHIHTALLHARQGDLSNAKLHADIANGALKEAAHYMTEEDYKVFCGEVAKAFQELEGKK